MISSNFSAISGCCLKNVIISGSVALSLYMNKPNIDLYPGGVTDICSVVIVFMIEYNSGPVF